jgi:hypothetical protein
MEQQKFFFDKEVVARRDKLLVMPLKQLPAQELQEYGGFALTQADWAARLDKPDWQLQLKLKTDGISLLLPDLQQLRQLASALKVRFRAEVALGRFDDAVRTAKTLFAMTRHLSDNPTLIGELVGIAVAFVAIGPLEEMLEQPGCPNLYWALTNLPRPLVPLDKGTEGERALLEGEFHNFGMSGAALEDRVPMTPEQLKKFIAQVDRVLLGLGGEGKAVKKGDGLRGFLDARVKDETKLSAARRRLAEYGIPEERLLQFPPEQVILLDEKREFEVRRDNVFKIMNVPFWQAEALGGGVYKPGKEPAVFADALVPALHRVRQAQVRLDQRIALLRHVEALRLHAAEHNGALPMSLAEITVPLPEDPVTGKPFRYELKGLTAHLRGTPPSGVEKEAPFNVHYEVTIQKAEAGDQKSEVRK